MVRRQGYRRAAWLFQPERGHERPLQGGHETLPPSNPARRAGNPHPGRADVLRLIVGSKLPAAERFKRWIFENVLPSIRRTGSYGAPRLDDPRALRQALLGYTERVIALEERLSVTKPRAAALERLAGRKGAESVRDNAMARTRPHGRHLRRWTGADCRVIKALAHQVDT